MFLYSCFLDSGSELLEPELEELLYELELLFFLEEPEESSDDELTLDYLDAFFDSMGSTNTASELSKVAWSTC